MEVPLNNEVHTFFFSTAEGLTKFFNTYNSTVGKKDFLDIAFSRDAERFDIYKKEILSLDAAGMIEDKTELVK
mgnify:CR=1 FL=1